MRPIIAALIIAAIAVSRCPFAFAEGSDAAYDYIIVGAGTAGSYLAHRLSLGSPDSSILLLEAGPDTLSNSTDHPFSNPNLDSLIPAYCVDNVLSHRLNYFYQTSEQTALNNRKLAYFRGKGLGGSSSINYMGWIKGYKGDYQVWADIVGDQAYGANEGWERLKKLENFDPKGVPDEYARFSEPDMKEHGTGGVIHYGVQKKVIPGMATFIEACQEAGFPLVKDSNSGEPIGVCMAQMAVWKGARSSSANQLLNAPGDIGAGLQRKSNLHVTVETQVVKILFKGKKASGVQVKSGKKYYASKEVIVSAGFIDTPKLFLLSGVGPEKELQKLGIEVIHDSPNVGKNLRDHSSVLINPVFSQDLKIPGGNSLFADADRLALEKKRWLDSYNGGKGEAVNELSRYGSSFAIAFNKYPISQRTSWPEWKNLTDAQKELFLDPKRPDTEILFIPGFLPPGATIPSGGSPNPFFQLFLLFQNQISRGEITLANRDPEVPAVLNPNYLTHPMDVRNCIETVKTTLRILRGERYKNIIEGVEFMSAGQTPVFIAPNKEQMEANTKKAVNGLYLNGIDGESDEIIEKWLRNSGIDQGYHGQGTMRMGKEGDPLRVVDSSGRVVGLESLRVADASVMPHLMNNHPQVAAYLAADVVADRIIEQWRAVGNGKP